MKENKLLQKLSFYYQIFFTSFEGNTNYFSFSIKILTLKRYHKRNTQKVQLLIKTNATSTTDFNPLIIILINNK